MIKYKSSILQDGPPRPSQCKLTMASAAGFTILLLMCGLLSSTIACPLTITDDRDNYIKTLPCCP